MGQKGTTLEYAFTLTGLTPLLMHRDDVEAADELMAWRKDPKNKSVSVAGDDRSPAWSWQTYLYNDGEELAIPQQNIMTALRYAGTRIASKGKSTFKAMSQSGIMMTSENCRFTNHGKPISLASIEAFKDEPFSVHKQEARDLGFELLVKRAKVGSSKHVRVRPRFDAWRVSGTLMVIEPAITREILAQMLDLAGKFAGLCDWRPSSKESPGPFGIFSSELQPLRAKKAV